MACSFQTFEQIRKSFEPDVAYLPALDRAVLPLAAADLLDELFLRTASGLARAQQSQGSPPPRGRDCRG
jgi:hypothetical protein